MADAFFCKDAQFLLRGKHVLFIGDSNVRAQYKDLVWLLHHNKLISSESLRKKLEASYLGDRLIHRSKLHRGRDFEEVRKFTDDDNNTRVDFMFVPRCYNEKIEDLLYSFKRRTKLIPDVIVMNSCLWDLCRWGPNGVQEYKDNMVKLMRLMSNCLPKECLVIWMTALPIAAHIRGGLIIRQIKCMESLLKFEIMEANTFARGVVVSHGFDFLDNHFFNRMQVHRRAEDGVHYQPIPVRFISNLLLTHICLSWGRQLPDNISSILLDKAIAQVSKSNVDTTLKIPDHSIMSKMTCSSPHKPRNRGLRITIHSSEDGETSRHCQLYQETAQYQRLPHFQNPQYFWKQNEQNSAQRSMNDQTQENSSCGGPHRYRNKRRRKKNYPYTDNRYNYHY